MPHAYSAAIEVVRRVKPHYARHISAAGHLEQAIGPLPGDDAMAAMIDAAFWASLRREEGFVPKISLAFLPPERSSNPMFFARALPLIPEALTRVAPAVERAGIHLGVWNYAEGLPFGAQRVACLPTASCWRSSRPGYWC